MDAVDTSSYGAGSELSRRLAALAPDRQACFALACADRLVAGNASPRAEELRTLLDLGWSGLTNGTARVTHVRAQLNAREDLDEDEVAAVAYALDSVLGDAGGALWAARRALDAAFDRIAYVADGTSFRPLADDEAEPVVQAELAWHEHALGAVESRTALPDLVARFRTI
jgi:hypothetical protein